MKILDKKIGMTRNQPEGGTMQGDKASIFTKEQEEGLLLLKRVRPFMIVWGAVQADTGEFRQGADPTRRKAYALARKGWLVATIG